MQEQVNNTINSVEEQLQTIVDKLLTVRIGTNVYDMSSNLTADVIQRISTTPDDVINIECPPGS